MKNRKRNRMKGYDYSRDNLYFVTICVQKMRCCFGEVVEIDKEKTDREVLGTALEITSTARGLSVRNDSIIPDEFHNNPVSKIMNLNAFGLIVQDRLWWLEKQYPYVLITNYVVMPNHVHAIIEIDSLKTTEKALTIKSLSSLVGAFKTTSSKLIHETGFLDFSWKRSFYDHIIRTPDAYEKISNYIDLNPQNWSQDSFFSEI
ncbi:transposase [Xanthomarina sp.]|uniref:transposase n=1 Tax=Xanthomarina sp. TaxID=1931211 RepID=UPI002B6FD8F7|nr:transposase [Xanthomarina sp.]HLV38332.1 transposase [Xanthomarina sp.]